VRRLRGFIVLAVSLLYLSYIFQLATRHFWTSGLGDWGDPYFINALLEHWYVSVRDFADPSSPPMYAPARKTLGYSHGLILFAPFYVPLRSFLHPFHAYNLTLFLVVGAGIVCLYVLLRKLGASFVESLLLSVFFFSSANLINPLMSIWSQRASVFLIPPVLLMLLVSWRLRTGGPRLALACLGGFLAALMYAQDFYTAHFALLFIATALLAEGSSRLTDIVAKVWKGEKIILAAATAALVVAVIAAACTYYVWTIGAVDMRLLGVRIRSHDWRRPFAVAVVALVTFLLTCKPILRPILRGARLPKNSPWIVALGLGAVAGSAVFFWIYLAAFLEHRAFPEEHLLRSLVVRDPSRWSTLLEFVSDLTPYATQRAFKAAFVVGILAWVPWFRVDRKARIYCLWFLALSAIALLTPMSLDGLSIWTLSLGRLPGFSVVRDPKRIIYLYELSVPIAAALLLARLPARSIHRAVISVIVFLFLVTDWNRNTLDFSRPVDVYERWIASPIEIDPACKSFFIRPASREYMSRTTDMWMLYNIDAVFISLVHSVPTLNGYSAWSPADWHLHHPTNDNYTANVTRWVDKNRLAGVCEFDIDARTMKVRVPQR
jgi:hypothetical protein